MGTDMTNAQKQQKVIFYFIYSRFVLYVVPFKLLMILKKEFKHIYKVKFIKDF